MNEQQEQPPLILGKACAALGNPPIWHGVNANCGRESAEYQWAAFIEEVCANHGLVMVSVGVLEEMEAEQ